MTGQADFHRDLSLDLPAVHEQVVVARRALRIFARMQGVSGRTLDNLLLVASELLSNAVDHGGGDSSMDLQEATNARMTMSFEVADKRWSLSVSDQGRGNVAEVRQLLHPSGPPNLEDERGRGFFLLSEMVDEVDVAPSADGRGLCITAALSFEPDESPSPGGAD